MKRYIPVVTHPVGEKSPKQAPHGWGPLRLPHLLRVAMKTCTEIFVEIRVAM